MRITLFLSLLLLARAANAQILDQLTYSGAVGRPSYTVSSLPACNAGSKGVIVIVTDAQLPVLGSVVGGGGALTVLAVCNGSGWIVG